MASLSDTARWLREKSYKKAEQGAMAILRVNPRHAQAWVYLGEALMRQGYGQAARVVFQRASLLDPQAMWTDAVQAELAKTPGGGARPDIEKLLETKKVTVAAAILTRNEERSIERCIRSLLDADAVDEVVVLDDGSTDRTLEIVGQFSKVKVVPNIRIDDNFAEKRNQGLAFIESDWVIWVDADEWLETEDNFNIREAAALFDDSDLPPVLNICLLNYIKGKAWLDHSSPRMFPLDRGLKFFGRVHEQVVREGQDVYGSEVSRHSVRIRLHHDGYEPDILQRKGKLERNIRLLRMMVQEEPENPGWLLYLGRDTLGSGDAEQALNILLEAERKAEKEPRFARMTELRLLLAKIYVAKHQYEQAEDICLRSLASEPNFPDTHYWLAKIRMRKAAMLLQQSEKELLQAKEAFRTYRGVVAPDRQILAWKADAALADLAKLKGNKRQS